jgi:carbonic anhydrase
MEKILNGIKKFRTCEFEQKRAFFERLAKKKQAPQALFITCSDSRVMPNEITHTDPGDLFLIRSAGNLIPPYGAACGGEIATVEYSLAVLGIQNVIICGHSCCGAIQAMLQPDSLEDLPAVKSWLQHAEATRRIVNRKYSHLSNDEKLVAAVQENVLVQINNLSTHPYVAARLSTGEIKIHGWYYDIASGVILQYDARERQFVEIGMETSETEPLSVCAMRDSA